MVVAGIEYLEEDAELFPDGSVRDATLARDTEIQGLPCAGERSVVYYPGGQLKLAWLSRPARIGTIPCSPGIVYLHENSGLLNATLAAPHQFGVVTVAVCERVTLDEGGGLLERSHRLNHDQTVNDIPCMFQYPIWLYANGRPSVVILAAPWVFGGQEYPRGTELFLGEDGHILNFYHRDLDSGRGFMWRVFGVFEAGFE